MTTVNSNKVNSNRLEQRVQHLAKITEAPPYTRRSFTDTYVAGRRWLAEEFRQAGLDVTVDAGGNLIGRMEGLDPELPPILMGSHIDTVVGGGRFDGILGVLAALEVVQTIQEQGIRLRHTVEVIDFLGEEPSDYGVSCIGSRAMVGALTTDMLDAVNPAGETLRDGIRRMGGRPEALTRGLRTPGSVTAFLELHIEQGRVLENAGKDIGIVTEIVGIHRLEVHIVGRADHAGTTPMHLRRDALVGAAHLVQTADRLAREWSSPIVATVGTMDISPNASNVVAEQVRLTLEVRSGDSREMDRFVERLLRDVTAYAAQRELNVTYEKATDSTPTVCSPVVREAIRSACETAGLSYMDMPSGAGHDAAFLARLAPMGMIFIPCRDGRSHSAEEWAEPAHMAAGAEVLHRSVLHLDRFL